MMDIIRPGRLLSKDLLTSESFDCYEAFGHGIFQRRLLALCALAAFLMNANDMAIPLISSDVKHWCKPPANSNISDTSWRNSAVPVDADGQLSRCHLFKHTEDPNGTETEPCQEWEYDDEQAKTSIVSEWNLVCERRLLMAAIIAVHNTGAFIFTIAAGSIADNIGRKPILLAGTALLLVSTGACCLSRSYVMQTTRMFFSSGSAGVVMSITVLSFFEVTIHDNRPLHILLSGTAGLLCSDLFYVTFEMVKLPWTLKETIFLLPTVLTTAFLFIIYESPRWLISKSRLGSAEVVMLAAAELNNFSYAQTAYIVRKLKSDIAVNAQRLPAIDEDVLGGCSIRRRAMIMCASCFSIVFTAFIDKYAPAPQEKHWIQLGTLLMNALGCVLIYPTLRRETMLSVITTCFAVLGSLQCLQSLAVGGEETILSLALMFASKTVFLPGVVLSFTYVLELFPTAVRGTAICWAYACGRLGGVAAFGALTLQRIGRLDLAYAFAGLLLFASLIALRCLPRATSVECAREKARRLSLISQRNIVHMKKTLEDPLCDGRKSKSSSGTSRSSVSSRGRIRKDVQQEN